jgi:transcriptional regulator with XRE-family HTH domain
VDDDNGVIGKSIKDRREALGISLRELAKLTPVDRGRLSLLEKGDPAIGPTFIGAVTSTLERLELLVGQDTPDVVTSTIDLPDGTKVTFSGPADGVAEAATRFLAGRGQQS